jgi:hypothetical protein
MGMFTKFWRTIRYVFLTGFAKGRNGATERYVWVHPGPDSPFFVLSAENPAVSDAYFGAAVDPTAPCDIVIIMLQD